jgi:hypothetical protein
MTNLTGKEHKLTKQDSSKGGKQTSIKKKLINRRKCNCTCPMFDTCLLASIGLKYNICYANNKQYPTLKKNLERLLTGEQSEFYEILNTIFADIIRITETEDDSSIRTKKMVMEAAEKLHNMKYGKKEKLEHSGDMVYEVRFVKEDSPDGNNSD